MSWSRSRVDAHMNGDCWPPSCPPCEIEDEMEAEE